MKENLTASILIIGNEILSGRVADKNTGFIATRLSELGIFLKEVRIIADNKEEIIEAVNFLRNKYSYLFTTGGIGPTHDDITTASIAAAFGVELEINNQILKEIESHYKHRGEKLNSAREKMAYFPSGAELITNDLTKAPGFKLKNVFVMAGIPIIMNNMFGYVEEFLEKSAKIDSISLKIFIGESHIAQELSDLQEKYNEIDIGSYPFTYQDQNINNEKITPLEFNLDNDIKHATDIVFRGNNPIIVDKAYNELINKAIEKNYFYK